MSKKVSQKHVKVLYQNLGGVWYAFADLGNEEIFCGAVPVSASTKTIEAKTAAKKKTTGGVKTTTRRKTSLSAA